MDEKRAQKNHVENELRQQALRVQRAAESMAVEIPSSARMVLTASHEDFLIAQHRGAASPEVVAQKVELMETELDALTRAKLGAMILRHDNGPAVDQEGSTSQNPSGGVA